MDPELDILADFECSWWLDRFLKWDWNHCCVLHDFGMSNIELARCVSEITPWWLDWMGWVMAGGVVIFGGVWRWFQIRKHKRNKSDDQNSK